MKVDGLIGTWNVIDERTFFDERLFLLESSLWGDSLPNAIVREDGELLLDRVENGFEDLLRLVETVQ